MNKQKTEAPGKNDRPGKPGQQPDKSGSQMGGNSGKSNHPDKSHKTKGGSQNSGNKTGMREDNDE